MQRYSGILLCLLGLATVVQADDHEAEPVWRESFLTKVVEAGFDAELLDRFLDGDVALPAFAAPNGGKLSAGRAQWQQYQAVIEGVAEKYRVDPQALMGIWGTETLFGGYLGDRPMGAVLEKFASDPEGRRALFAEEEILAALELIEAGDYDPSTLQGSRWGAVGLTQFMPTAWRHFGQDGDGDGRRDPFNLADAMASSAQYLAEHGWRYGEPWGVPAMLPEDFETLIGPYVRRPAAHWNELGVRLEDGGDVPDYGRVALVKRGGAVWAIFDNFYVIKTYNHSNDYAFDVAGLGDKVVGPIAMDTGEQADRYVIDQAAFLAPDYEDAPLPLNNIDVAASLPTHNDLTRDDMRELQFRLDHAGFELDEFDGKWGPNTAGAISDWQTANGQEATGQADKAMLAAIIAAEKGGLAKFAGGDFRPAR